MDAITTNDVPNNINLFETPGALTVQECKNHCNPKWADGSNANNVQFCIKSNIFCLFVKNSCDQTAIDELHGERQHWIRPGGGNGKTLLISMCCKNVHGTRASNVVANSELLSMRSKDF